jgi:putative transposase
VLSASERRTLSSWSRLAGKTPREVGLRARIVLAAASGALSKDIAIQQRITPATVCKWRKLFLMRRLEGLWSGRT